MSNKTTKNCSICGKKFWSYKNREKVFCSQQCYDKFRSAKQKYICPVCDTTFFDYSRLNRKFCSRECYYKFKTGKFYEEIFGEEKGLKYRKNKRGETKGMTFEERFGEEKAKEIKEKISKNRKRADLSIHPKEVSKYIKQFEKKEFRCIRLDERPIPDFIAIKGENIKAFAIEVQRGAVQSDKYVDIRDYDDIYWIVIMKEKRKIKSDKKRKTIRGIVV